MSDAGRIIQVIFDAINEFNQQSPAKHHLEKSPKTILYGESGILDSLALVDLLLTVEEKIEEEFGIAITIADERAVSQVNSPFQSIASLSDYITQLLVEKIRG